MTTRMPPLPIPAQPAFVVSSTMWQAASWQQHRARPEAWAEPAFLPLPQELDEPERCLVPPLVSNASPHLVLDVVSPRAGSGPSPHLVSAVRSHEASVKVVGRVVALSHDPTGCRLVQDVLEHAANDETRTRIADELRGHVWAAVQCPNANYVLQKCIEVVSRRALSFIVEELAAGPGPCEAARHRFGCRVIERLVERCPWEELRPLVDELMADAANLFAHPSGTYVVRCLLEHAPRESRARIHRVLEQHLHVADTVCHARGVISQALLCAEREELASLSREICKHPGLLSTMARTRHGHVGVLRLVRSLGGAEGHEVRRQLQEELPIFKGTRFGRLVVAALAGA